MPWKENNNGEGPWGEPDQKPSNNSKKKKYVFNIDSILSDFLLKIKRIFFNGGSNNKKSFAFESSQYSDSYCIMVLMKKSQKKQ